jgi:hypothetical protein
MRSIFAQRYGCHRPAPGRMRLVLPPAGYCAPADTCLRLLPGAASICPIGLDPGWGWSWSWEVRACRVRDSVGSAWAGSATPSHAWPPPSPSRGRLRPEVVGLTDALGHGVELGSAPSVGAMNILVMGLESRTTLQGQNLSVQQLTETHSGNETEVEAGLEGSQDTDMLILIHVFADGKTALGFSIPVTTWSTTRTPPTTGSLRARSTRLTPTPTTSHSTRPPART